LWGIFRLHSMPSLTHTATLPMTFILRTRTSANWLPSQKNFCEWFLRTCSGNSVFPSVIIFTEGTGYSTYGMISMHGWQSTLNLALHAQARAFSKHVGKHCRRHDCWTLLSHPYVTAAVLPRLYIKHPLRGIARCESAHQESFMAYAWWCLTIFSSWSSCLRHIGWD